MHIAVLGPMSLDLLPLDGASDALPEGYPAPIVSGIVRGLLEKGFRVTAITTSFGISEPQTFAEDGLTLVVVPRYGPRSALDFFKREREQLLHAIRQSSPDVLHAHWSYEFAGAALDSGLPTLVTVHDSAPRVLLETLRSGESLVPKAKQTIYRGLRMLMSASVLNRACYLSCPSQYLVGTLPPRHRAKARIIPDFIETETLPEYKPVHARKRSIVVVSNGFHGWKNVDTALEAFNRSQSRQAGWALELVGQDMEPDGSAARWARAHGLEEGVVFNGPLPYLRTLELISSSSVMVHPSREESFGMSVLESMAMGIPVIGGERAGNVPYLLSDGAGILCDVESVDSLAAAIDLMTANVGLRECVGEAARQRAIESYHRDVVMNLYVEYLVDIAHGGSE